MNTWRAWLEQPKQGRNKLGGDFGDASVRPP